MRGTIAERFWSKVAKGEGCWEWQGSLDTCGYGRFWLPGKPASSHRVAHELTIGPIPPGMEIDHICHNRACVNTSHLRLATHKQNQEHRRGAQVDSKSGVRGVHWNEQRRRWVAQVRHHSRTIYIGSYKRIEDASAAVAAKRLELFTHNDTDRLAGMSTDPRVYIASKALAEAMGVPDERRQYIPEARAVLRALDSADPLRKEAA